MPRSTMEEVMDMGVCEMNRVWSAVVGPKCKSVTFGLWYLKLPGDRPGNWSGLVYYIDFISFKGQDSEQRAPFSVSTIENCILGMLVIFYLFIAGDRVGWQGFGDKLTLALTFEFMYYIHGVDDFYGGKYIIINSNI